MCLEGFERPRVGDEEIPIGLFDQFDEFHLGAEAAEKLHARLAQLGIAGGAVYDALVAVAAAEHGVTLATRDRRAAETYRALDIDFELID